MTNLFDAGQAPTTEPLQIVAGDFVQWKVLNLVEDYPTALYTLTYTARISGARDEFQILATGHTTHYLVTASSAITGSYSTGTYQWQQEITRISDSARLILRRGTFTVLSDLDVAGADVRSHAEIMIDKIESVLNGKADSDVSSYSIAGRSLTKMTFSELTQARDYYRAEFMRETADADAKAGRKGKATIKVRF
tara:strand:- start:3932 stop:4513 length:582 start_codon:yes stop_codon:yes gene_type:complete